MEVKVEHSNTRPIVLSLLVAVVLTVTVVVIGSNNQVGRTTNRGNEKLFHLEAERNYRSEQRLSANEERSSPMRAHVKVIEDGWAAPLQGVYFVQGNTATCFELVVNPHGINRGFEVQVSAAMASTFLSGNGYTSALTPLRGYISTYHKGKNPTQVKFQYYGTSIVINGLTYLKRPSTAPWKCTTLNYGTTSPFSGWWNWHTSTGAQCQLMLHDPTTGGYVMYYPNPMSQILQCGAGIYDEKTNSGWMGGYTRAGALDGFYPISMNAAKDQILFRGGRAFVKSKPGCGKTTGYPKITQTLGKATTRAPTAAPVAVKRGPVSAPNCKLDTPTCVSFQGHAKCTQTRTCCTTQQLANVPSAYFQSCPESIRNIFGLGWRLVRRVGPSHKVWHPAKDQLAGTEVYGKPPHKDTDDVTYSEKFVYDAFNQFLFMSGDCKNWVIASRMSVIGVSPYSNAPRTACATSVSPHKVSQPRWYRRAGQREDPWVTTVDQAYAWKTGQIVYVGNNSPDGPVKSQVPHNGANVYIRAKMNFDANGC